MEIDLSLIRKILFQTTPGAASDQRISQNALEAVGELMRQFITETHRRASVEAEFENEMKNRSKTKEAENNHDRSLEEESITSSSVRKLKRSGDMSSSTDDNDDDFYGGSRGKNKRTKTKRKLSFVGEHNGEDNLEEGSTIQPKHIIKVSAEILMDFS